MAKAAATPVMSARGMEQASVGCHAWNTFRGDRKWRLAGAY